MQQVKDEITRANFVKLNNFNYNNKIRANHKHKVIVEELLGKKKNILKSIERKIETEYLSTQGKTLPLGFPKYTSPILTKLTSLKGIEEFIKKASEAKKAVHNYNVKLQEADLIVIAHKMKLIYINDLKNIVKLIPSEIKFPSTTLKFNPYTIPKNLESLTLEELKDQMYKASIAKIDNEAYKLDNDERVEHAKVLQELVNKRIAFLTGMTLETKYISTQHQIITLKYPTQTFDLSGNPTLSQVEEKIKEKRNAQVQAHKYNVELKKADSAATLEKKKDELRNLIQDILGNPKLSYSDISTHLTFNRYSISDSAINDLKTLQKVEEQIIMAKIAKIENIAYNKSIKLNYEHKLANNELLKAKKVLLTSITPESKYVSTHNQVIDLKYPTTPSFSSVTLLNIDQHIIDAQYMRKQAHNYNVKLKKADLVAYVQDLKAIEIPAKVEFTGVTSSLPFVVYAIPTNIGALTLEKVKDEIIKARLAKIADINYNNNIKEEHKYNANANALLQSKINLLASIIIEPEYFSNQNQVLSLKYEVYIERDLNGASLSAIEHYIADKLYLREKAHDYNALLKKADSDAKAQKFLLVKREELRNIEKKLPARLVLLGATTSLIFNEYQPHNNIDSLTLEEVKKSIAQANVAVPQNLAYNIALKINYVHKLIMAKLLESKKELLRHINIESKYISTQGQTSTLKYPDNIALPQLDGATLEQVVQLIKDRLELQKAASNYNFVLREIDAKIIGKVNLNHYIKQLKEISIPTKTSFEGITSLLHFNIYSIPTNIGDLTLEQVQVEIQKANNAKAENIAYNADIINNHKHKLEADKFLESEKHNLGEIEIMPKYVSSHGLSIDLQYPTYQKPSAEQLASATLQQVLQFIKVALAAQVAANTYNLALGEADFLADDAISEPAQEETVSFGLSDVLSIPQDPTEDTFAIYALNN